MRKFSNAAYLSILLLAARVNAADPCSVADLRQDLESGDYTGAILGANQFLDESAGNTDAAERAHVLAIKGEAHLQVHAYDYAADAYTQAGKLSTDEKAAAEYAATALLIRRSSEGLYKPKVSKDGQNTTPIDISVRSNRKGAFAALFADQLAANQSKLKAGASAETIPQILRAMDTVQTLRQIELAATDKDDQMKDQSKDLSDHAYTLMDGGLITMDQHLGRIAAQAERQQRESQRMMMSGYGSSGYNGGSGFGGGGLGGGGFGSAAQQTPTRISLSSSTQEDLNDMISTAQKIKSAATTFSAMAEDNSKWATLSTSADSLTSKAKDVLNGNYASAAESRHGPGNGDKPDDAPNN